MGIIKRIGDLYRNRLRIKGIVAKGCGVASKTLEQQMKIFAYSIPNLRNYHLGTINLLVEKPLIFSDPPIKTDFIKWNEHFPAESFQFVPCELEAAGKRVKAMIYIPSWSPHTPSTQKWEVIASEFVKGIEPGDIVTLIFPKYLRNRSWGAVI